MCGCLDPQHVIKRFCFHIATSSRTVEFGAFGVELCILLHGGLSVRAYSSVDVQSDSDAAKKTNPAYLSDHPLEDGCLIVMVVQSLISLAWTGSAKQSFSLSFMLFHVFFFIFCFFDIFLELPRGISVFVACPRNALQGLKLVFQHSLLAFYILLLAYHDKVKDSGPLWNRRFLPLTTLKNLLAVCAHSVIAAMNWDPSVPWKPGSRTEAPAEFHFSMIKRHFRGSPSLKDLLLGTQHCHLDQCRNQDLLKSKIKKALSQKVEPLSHTEAVELSEKCFTRAVKMMSWITVNKDSSLMLTFLTCVMFDDV